MTTSTSRYPLPDSAPDPAAAALAELAELIGIQEAPGDWADSARCRDSADDLHWPVGREDSPGYLAQAARAIEDCSWCSVRTQCLAHALEQNETEGIWGGTTPSTRRQLAAVQTDQGRVLRPAS